MKNLTTSFARAAMLLLLAVFTTTPALAQEPDLGFITNVPTVDGGQASGWSDGALWHLVDGDLTSKYGVTNANPWIEFHYSSAITPKGYALWTAGDTEGRRNPKTWTIMAKNSGDADWTVLTTVDNSAGDKLPMANNTRTLFSLDNSTAYQYYRFEATRTTSGENANQFQLAELQFCTVSPAPYLQYARVTGLQSSYQYDDGNDIAIDYTVTAPDGNVLTKGTHFTETIKNSSDETVTSVAAKGNYTLTITAIAPYYGSQTLNFSVIDGNDLSTITSNYTAQDGETLTGTLGSNVKISIADGATVTLNDVTINGNGTGNNCNWAGITCEGDATIILKEGSINNVTGFFGKSGIFVPQGKTLTIKGSGTLYATCGTASDGYSVGAGIGGSNSQPAGNIRIEGGVIYATGAAAGGAGIGGGWAANASCGSITITGGTVTATGGVSAAGIGAGYSSSSNFKPYCGDIIISGGTVCANGGWGSAGIGGSADSNCGKITITNEVYSVTAQKGDNAPYSIGAGKSSSCGTVTIGGVETGNIAQSPITYKPSENFNYTVAFNRNGGSGSMDNQQFLYGFAQNLRANTFTYTGRNFLGWSTTPDDEVAYTDGQSVTTVTNATANSTVTLYAQWNHNIDLSTLTGNFTAINGDVLTGTLGGNYKISIAGGATVTLNDVTINGNGTDSNCNWAGITCEGDATIILKEGSINNVTGFYFRSGIFVPQGKTLTIKGSGTLYATCGTASNGHSSVGAGIGGSNSQPAGNIRIEGGVINATGGRNGAAGIGSGYSKGASCGSITITGGTVTATGGGYAAGIGAGYSGSSNPKPNCGDIIISGGTVYAYGGNNSAGIGGSADSNCGIITITNEVYSVTAQKGNNAPYSIGAGKSSSCGTVTIGGIETGNIAQSPITYKPSENFNYTVAFNRNGGSGSMDNQQFLYGFAQNLRANTFTYIGRNFLGWSTTTDGEVAYTDGQSVTTVTNATANSTVTLYAQWNHNIDLSTLTGNFTAINGDVLTGTLGGNYKISIAGGATVTLQNATINGVDNSSYDWAGITCEGNATIVLASGTMNTVKGFYMGNSGIYVPAGKTLTINGSGTLNASAYDFGCGIEAAGNVIIQSGTITATGGKQAAGIGSKNRQQNSGNITITGGTVTTTGGSGAAGIGSASGASCGNITISGGIVTTTGGPAAAGIGSGYIGSTCGGITITTGVTSVTATKGEASNNSIGAGNGSSCGTITIGGVEKGKISQSPFVTYPYTVAFNANGGTGTIEDMNFMYNVPQNLSDNTFTHTNGAFIEWNTQAGGSGTALADGQNVSNLASTSGATVTLYAQWQGGELVDGTPYKATQDGSVSTATYTRTIEESRVGKHQSWLVPFDYTIKATDLDKFSFYKINMIANAPNPGEGTSSDLWVFLTKLETAGIVLHANMPYVIKAKEAVTNYAFTSSNVTLKAKNTGVILKTETAEDVYSFYATYEDTPASGSDQFYYVSSLGNICLGTSVTIGPYRWIVRKTNKFGGTTSYAREMHFFDGEEDDATGLNEFDNFTNSQSDDCWYDLSGRIVKSSNSPSVKLPRGIYIHGGRKEAIR